MRIACTLRRDSEPAPVAYTADVSRAYGKVFRELCSEWVDAVIGTFSVSLFLVSLFTSGVPRSVLWLFAVACLYFAAYRIWKRKDDAFMKCKAMLDARPRMRLDILDCLYLSAPHPDDVVAAFAKGPDMDMMPRLVLAIKLGVGCIEPTGFTVPDAFIRASLQSVFCKQDALPFLK